MASHGKNYRGAYWPTQVDIFRDTIFRPLKVLRPQRDWTRLPSAHPRWDAPPQKKMKISVDFLPLQTLIANISGMGQHIENRKDLISSDCFSVRRNRSGELWSTTYREFHVSLNPLKCTFLADCISAHRGCCALKLLQSLALIAHTRIGTGSPPQKKINRENLKYGWKFSVLATITSGLVGVSPQNNFHTTCHEAGVITLVLLLEGLPPKIWEGEKTSKIQGDFWQLSTLIANISGTTPDIQNRKEMWSTAIPLGFHE